MKRILPLFLAALLAVACNNGGKPSQADPVSAIDYSAIKIPEISADSAYRFVAEQLDFGFRAPGTKGHDQCAKYLESQMRRWCDTVIVQNFTATLWDGSTFRGHNIIASFSPEKDNRVLLGAHWDSRLWADHDSDAANHHKPIMGANDGASGVGALMEMARAMATQRPEAGVDIIFFDMEDQGIPEWADIYKDNTWCLGSQFWANNPHRPFYRASYGILFDMVGTRNLRFTKEEISRTYASGITDRIFKCAEALGYGNIFVNQNTDAILDDHMYVNQIIRIPMVDLVQNTPGCSFFPYWHTVEDNLDCIDAESLKTTATVAMKMIYAK